MDHWTRAAEAPDALDGDPHDRLIADLDTLVGCVRIEARDECIVRLTWSRRESRSARSPATGLLAEAVSQVRAYFDRQLEVFDLPLKPAGGPFQQAVCAAMREIPYGETRTYGDLARALDTMPQPVGQACGGNSIPIIIPCHRVLAANGLGGFSGAGGVESKIELLKHEGAFPYLL